MPNSLIEGGWSIRAGTGWHSVGTMSDTISYRLTTLHGDTSSTFTKRRGAGRLKVSLRAIDGLVELESVEFLDDVALTYQDRTVTTKVGERTHELLIKKGSIFRMAR